MNETLKFILYAALLIIFLFGISFLSIEKVGMQFGKCVTEQEKQQILNAGYIILTTDSDNDGLIQGGWQTPTIRYIPCEAGKSYYFFHPKYPLK